MVTRRSCRARWRRPQVTIRPMEKIRSRIIAAYHRANQARARQAVEALVRDGRHVGPVPYGYRAERIRGPGHRPSYRRRLVVEPGEAAVVQLIFLWRGYAQLSIAAIVRGLNRRNRSRAPIDAATGVPRRWTSARVEAILNNPACTGRAVWGRRRGGRPVPPTDWVLSQPGAHAALVDDASFARAAVAHPWTSHLRSAA